MYDALVTSLSLAKKAKLGRLTGDGSLSGKKKGEQNHEETVVNPYRGRHALVHDGSGDGGSLRSWNPGDTTRKPPSM